MFIMIKFIINSRMTKKIRRLSKNYKHIMIKIFRKENYFKMDKMIFSLNNKKICYKIFKKKIKIPRKYIVNSVVLMIIISIKITNKKLLIIYLKIKMIVKNKKNLRL